MDSIVLNHAASTCCRIRQARVKCLPRCWEDSCWDELAPRCTRITSAFSRRRRKNMRSKTGSSSMTWWWTEIHYNKSIHICRQSQRLKLKILIKQPHQKYSVLICSSWLRMRTKEGPKASYDREGRHHHQSSCCRRSWPSRRESSSKDRKEAAPTVATRFWVSIKSPRMKRRLALRNPRIRTWRQLVFLSFSLRLMAQPERCRQTSSAW